MVFSWLRKGLRTGVLTTRYPAVHESMEENFRGHPILNMRGCRADEGCSACVQVCLPSALQVSEVAVNENDRREQRTQLTLDYARCIMCGLCVTACPADALQMTGDYELAAHTREDLKTITVFSPTNEGPRAKNGKEQNNDGIA